MTFLPFVLLDDFAFKRGQSYGTLFCNAITGLPVDLIPSRKQEEVTNWLKQYPFIQLVSRDGSTTYRKAIQEANPDIIQLMDRFHLAQLLYAAQLKALKRLLPSRWLDGSDSPKDTSLLSEESTITLPAKQQEKWRCIQAIRADYQANKSMRSLAKKYGLARATIKKYLTLDDPVTRQCVRSRPSMLQPFMYSLWEGLAQKKTAKSIFEDIQLAGYQGGFDSVRVKLTQLRKEQAFSIPSERWIFRKEICILYWKLHADLSTSERLKLNQALSRFPETQCLYAVVQQIRFYLNEQTTESVDGILHVKESMDIPEIHSFLSYVRKDKQAIKASFEYPFSNGPIEGQINRLKCIKRMLYGRAGAPLLRKRVLYHI